MTSELALAAISAAMLAAAPPAKAPAGIQDCAKNLNCLILAAKNCTPAKATHQTNVRLGDSEVSATFVYEVKGWEGTSRKCQFQKVQTAGTMRLGPQARAAIAKQGGNAVQAEKEANQQISEQLNRSQSCSAPAQDLAQQIQNWRDGKFSSDDLCSTPLKWEIPRNSKGK